MRLFIAINLSDAMKGSLINTQNALYDLGVRGNYTSEENLYLTLAFIGEYSNAEPVLDALSSVSFRPFELSLEGMGRFGDLWWAGIQDTFRKYEKRALSDCYILQGFFRLQGRDKSMAFIHMVVSFQLISVATYSSENKHRP